MSIVDYTELSERQQLIIKGVRKGMRSEEMCLLEAAGPLVAEEVHTIVCAYVIREGVNDLTFGELDKALEHINQQSAMAHLFEKFPPRDGDPPDITVGELVKRAAAEGDKEATMLVEWGFLERPVS